MFYGGSSEGSVFGTDQTARNAAAAVLSELQEITPQPGETIPSGASLMTPWGLFENKTEASIVLNSTDPQTATSMLAVGLVRLTSAVSPVTYELLAGDFAYPEFPFTQTDAEDISTRACTEAGASIVSKGGSTGSLGVYVSPKGGHTYLFEKTDTGCRLLVGPLRPEYRFTSNVDEEQPPQAALLSADVGRGFAWTEIDNRTLLRSYNICREDGSIEPDAVFAAPFSALQKTSVRPAIGSTVAEPSGNRHVELWINTGTDDTDVDLIEGTYQGVVQKFAPYYLDDATDADGRLSIFWESGDFPVRVYTKNLLNGSEGTGVDDSSNTEFFDIPVRGYVNELNKQSDGASGFVYVHGNYAGMFKPAIEIDDVEELAGTLTVIDERIDSYVIRNSELSGTDSENEAVIQSYLDLAGSPASLTKVVTLQAGTFRGNWTIPDLVTVKGAGKGSTIIEPLVDAPVFTNDNTQHVNSIGFKDFSIAGNAAFPLQDGILLNGIDYWVNGVTISNVFITSCGRYGIAALGHSVSKPAFVQQLAINESKVINCVDSGLLIYGAVLETTVTNTFVVNCGGSTLETIKSNILLSYSLETSTVPHRINFYGLSANHINGVLIPGAYGLEINGAQQVSLYGGDIENSYRSIMIKNGLTNAVKISGVTMSCTSVVDALIEVEDVDGLDIESSIFKSDAAGKVTNGVKLTKATNRVTGLNIANTNTFKNIAKAVNLFTNQTVSSGAIRAYRGLNDIAPESGTTDDIVNIFDVDGTTAGLVHGQEITLRAQVGTSVFTLKSTGNIAANTDIVLSGARNDAVTLRWSSINSKWLVVGSSTVPIAQVAELPEALADKQSSISASRYGLDSAAITSAIAAAHTAGHGNVTIDGAFIAAGIAVPSNTKFIFEPGSTIRHTGTISDGSIFEVLAVESGTVNVAATGAITGQTIADGTWVGIPHAHGVSESQNSTLASDIDSSVLSFSIADGGSTGWAGTGHLWIDDELVAYSAYSAGTFTLSARGVSGTTAAAHTTAAVVGYTQRLWGHVLGNKIYPKPYKALTGVTLSVGVANVTFEGPGLLDGYQRGMIDDLPNSFAVKCVGTSNVNINVSTYDTEHGAVFLQAAYKTTIKSPNITRSKGIGDAFGGSIIIFGSCQETLINSVHFQGRGGSQTVFIDDRSTTITPDSLPPVGQTIELCSFDTDFTEIFDDTPGEDGACIAIGPSERTTVKNNVFSPTNESGFDSPIRCVSITGSTQGVSENGDHGVPLLAVVEGNAFKRGTYGVFSGSSVEHVSVGTNYYAPGILNARTTVKTDFDDPFSIGKTKRVGVDVTQNNNAGWSTFETRTTTKSGEHLFSAVVFYSATSTADIEFRFNADAAITDFKFVGEGQALDDNASPVSGEVRRSVGGDVTAIPLAGGDAVEMCARFEGSFVASNSGEEIVMQFRQRNTEVSDATVYGSSYTTITRV